ncbi:MAG TPA: hypothetical protein VH761_02040 [Ilumatobacteraceae bacterium]
MPVQEVPEVVFTPQDFRLNLQARLAEPLDGLTDLDSPAIRKLKWEQVVPERLEGAETPPSTPVVEHPVTTVPPPPPPVVGPEPQLTDFVTPMVVVAKGAEQQIGPPAVVTPRPEPVQVAAPEPPPTPPARPEPAPVVEEVNTLHSVPDMEVDDSPIEIPTITPSGPVAPQARSVYTPVLPETLLAVSPRPAAPNVAAIVAESNAAWHRTTRKRKRHIVRTFFSLIVLAGLLGGGAYAAKQYLLREPQWPTDIKPLASGVETQRGLEFKDTVEITLVPAAEYGTRLAAAAIHLAPEQAAAWRAVGLLNGELDLDAIGRQAVTDAPAFYDWSTKTILVSDDLAAYEHLYRFAMRRALTSALLDQHFEWGARLATASPAGGLALRATIDADALNVANTLAAGDAPDQLQPELFTFVQAHGNAVSPSPYAAAIAGRVGSALRPIIATTTDPAVLAALEQGTPASDAAFDGVRLQTAVPAAPDSHGLVFWYYVLASRIDDGQAWSAAVRWAGDTWTPVVGATGTCIDATVAAGDAEGAAVLLNAFQSWAAAAPAETTTTVSATADNQVAVHACDPGATLTAQAAPKIPLSFGGAGAEGALVQASVSAATSAQVDAACLIAAARQRGVAFTAPADDAPVLAVDWKPPYVDANLDLATGCVAAAPQAPAVATPAASVTPTAPATP